MNSSNSIKRQSFLHFTIFSLLFLVTLNLLNAFYYLVFIVCCFAFVVFGFKIKFDFSSVALLVLSISLICFSPMTHTSLPSVLKPLVYPMCYVLGYSLQSIQIKDEDPKKSETTLIKTGIVLAAGALARYILNWISNFGSDSRNNVDIWTKETLGATNQSAMACMAIAIAISFLFFKVGVKYKVISVAVILVALAYNLVLAGRTLLVLVAILILISTLYRISSAKGRIWFICIVSIVALGLFGIYKLNLFNIRGIIQDSVLYERFFGDFSQEITDDSRFDIKLNYFKYMALYPFGGFNLRKAFGYGHDILLDTYDEAGIFALVAVLTYLLLSILRLIKCIKSKQLSFGTRIMILCFYAAVYIEFMLEPVLQGLPWLFAAFCVIDGYTSSLLKQKRKLINNFS